MAYAKAVVLKVKGALRVEVKSLNIPINWSEPSEEQAKKKQKFNEDYVLAH